MSSLPLTLSIGHAVADGPGDGMTALQSDAHQLRPHLEKPWLRSYLRERVTGGQMNTEETPNATSGLLTASAHALQRHSIVVGSTGMGKSRLMRHMIREQLRSGCSLIALDPKDETILDLVEVAREVGIPEDKVTVIRPQDKRAPIPGWNPLLAVPDSVESSARDLTDLMKSIFQSSWGVQLGYFLRNALVIMATHRLTLAELPKFLTHEAYREHLLQIPVEPEDPVAYTKACECFQEDFAARGKSERSAAVSPILNKIQGFVANAYLAALLCPGRQTLHLEKLWTEQRLLLVHLDETNLGDEGAQLLGGMIAHFALRSAFRVGQAADRHVVLSLDELGVQEKFIGPTVIKAVRIGRSYKIRLLLAGQDFEQMSPDLRTTVLANPSVKVFFRLGYKDAKYVATSLTAGAVGRISKITLGTVPRAGHKGQVEIAIVQHLVQDGDGLPVQVPHELWLHHSESAMKVGASGPAKCFLDELGSHQGRLYVRSPETKKAVPLHQYLEGVPEKDYWLSGPYPLELNIAFPEPKVIHVERQGVGELEGAWLRQIQDLEIQHAVVKISDAPAKLVKAVDVQDRPVTAEELEAYRIRALRANGQSQKEIKAVAQWRTQQIRLLAEGYLTSLPTWEQHSSEIAKASVPVQSSSSSQDQPSELHVLRISEAQHGTGGVKEVIPTGLGVVESTTKKVVEVADDGSFA